MSGIHVLIGTHGLFLIRELHIRQPKSETRLDSRYFGLRHSNDGVVAERSVKDFRVIPTPPSPHNSIGLATTVAAKAADTRAGLADAAASAVDPSERALAAAAQEIAETRVKLHLEPHSGPRIARFPAGFPALIRHRSSGNGPALRPEADGSG